MKIAIPSYEGRVAPLFDHCKILRIFSFNEDGRKLWQEFYWQHYSLAQRLRALKRLQVQAVVCNGISPFLLNGLRGSRIRVWPNVCGEIDVLLSSIEDWLKESTYEETNHE